MQVQALSIEYLMKNKFPMEVLHGISSCKLKEEDVMFMIGLFDHKLTEITLFYRGTVHGWFYHNFHNKCDKRGPTISLFQIKDGDCIGGFTRCQWSSPKKYNSKLKYDDSSVVFNLTCHRSFKI